MTQNEKAAPGTNRTRPAVEIKPGNYSESAPAAQVARVWRITRRPLRLGERGADLPLVAFDRLDAFLQGADYLWLIARDGRSLALVEGDFFERIRRAAHGHAPALDPLDLDALHAAETEARDA